MFRRGLKEMTNVETDAAPVPAESNPGWLLPRALRGAAVAVVISTLDEGRIVDANQAFFRLIGLDAASIIGRTALELGLWDNPAVRADFIAPLQSGAPMGDRELVLHAGDGALRQVLVSGELMDIDGHSYLFSQLTDITERRRLELALSEQERRYRAIFDNARELIVLTSAAGLVLDANQAALNLINLQLTDVAGLPVWETRWFAGEPIVRDWIATAANGAVLRGELHERLWSGEPSFIEVSLTPVLSEAGAVASILIEARDLTALEQTRAALYASEKRFHAFMDNAPILAWIKDADLRYAYVNKRVAERYGLDERKAAGITDVELMGAEAAVTVQDNDRRVLDTGQTLEAVEETPDFQGQLHQWLSYKFPFTDAAGARYVGGMALDLTDRFRAERLLRESEARFLGAFENAPIGMALVGADGQWMKVNRALCELLGYPEPELVALTFQDVTHPDDLSTDQALMEQVLAGEIPGYRMDKRYLHRDGHVVWAELVVSLVRSEDGPRYFVFQVHDVTERRTAEGALRTAKEAAEEASYLKSTFLATVSHELRTPMTAILGYTDLLLEEPRDALTERQREDVRTIAWGGQRLLRLINDLLDLSKIEAGRLDLDVRTVNLGEIMAQVMPDIGMQASAKGVWLDIDAPPQLSSIVGDAHRLRQVLLNLTGNAVKFTARGRVGVTVRDRGEAGVEITVADTGIGISPEALPLVFEEFRQADPGATRKYGGTGLGLPIARKLVELHGGTIQLASVAGAGTTVTVALPRGPGELARIPLIRTWPSTASRAPHVVPHDASGAPRVLVVEDDEGFLSILRRRVVEHGGVVQAAHTGEEALHLARVSPPPALVLLDLLLPGPFDGWQVLNGLRNFPETAATPVIVISVVDDTAAALALGATECVIKPVGPGVIRSLLRRHLPARHP